MRYLIVDGMPFGTGIRDAIEGGFVSLSEINISNDFALRLKSWLSEYEEEHYNSYKDSTRIGRLDDIGIDIAKQLQAEIQDSKIEYYSAGKCLRTLI